MTDDNRPQVGADGALRRGLWNYAMDRWAPRNPAARLGFEMGILIAFFVVLAVVAKLASS